MKILLNIFLSLNLLIGQAGVMLHYHYCPMMKKADVSINDTKPASSCCGNSSASSCCKHTYKFIQLKDNFFGSSHLKVEKIDVNFSFITYVPKVNFYKSESVKHLFTDSSPPPFTTPVFLRNRVLLI
jgi:hypothetical protein